jgi:hypothetical protein
MTFDGPGANEDFGLEQISGNALDRYSFRTSPLRNIARGVMPHLATVHTVCIYWQSELRVG